MAKSSGKVGSLFYGMTLDTKEFKKRLKSVRKNTKTIGREISGTFKAIAKAGSFIGAGMGVASSAMLLFTKASLDAVKAQTLLAESIGSTQGEIAGLELLSKTMGVETQLVLDKMREFGGIDKFKSLAEQVKNAGDEQAQLNKAVAIFGNDGSKMIAILRQGEAGFTAMEQRARDLGLALSPDQLAESRIVWEQLIDTWDHVKGLATQVAQSLKVPLGLLAAATKGFIKGFKTEILGGFDSLGVTMKNFMEGTLKLFVNYGVPFINGFINGASQIGEAFATLFNWLNPAADGSFSTLSGFFTKVTDFLATIKDSLTFGIAKILKGMTNGIFNAIEVFRAFIATQVTTLAFMMESIGAEDEGFGQAVSDEFADQRAKLYKFQKSITKPLAIAQKDSFNGMVKTIEKQIEKNKKMSNLIMGSIGEFTMKLAEVKDDTAEKTATIVAKAAAGASKQMIGMIQSGSQEEQNILNRKQDKNLILQQKQLKAQEATAKAVMRWDVF
tara:strand:+ start:4748 stop:6247 length:1500 start_codon:yes stop_codon:yes gene_type:complete